MAFMVPVVYEGDYLSIDGPMGGEIIPCDVVDLRVEQIAADVELKANGAYYKATMIGHNVKVPESIKDYCENTITWSIDRAHGFLARMSAPGYMDATSWSAHKTEAEAREYLTSMYGDEE